MLVMEEGKAVEFDSPIALLEQSDSVFAELVNSTGEDSARALREMASTGKAPQSKSNVDKVNTRITQP